MTTALEKYYKDVKIAILTGKREAKDLDMRYTRAKLFIYLTQKVHVAYIDLLSEVVLAQLASFFDVTRSIHRGHTFNRCSNRFCLAPVQTGFNCSLMLVI